MIETTQINGKTIDKTYRNIRLRKLNFENKKFEHDLKEILEIDEIDDKDLVDYLEFLWNTDTFKDAKEAKDFMITFCEGYKFLMLKQKGE